MTADARTVYEQVLAMLDDGEEVSTVLLGDGEPVPAGLAGRLLTLEQARPALDLWLCERWPNGSALHFYMPPAIYIWTTSRIIFTCWYDGRSWLNAVPRHPAVVVPELMGDG